MKAFYTYLWLREDGTPYYVGKGKDYRAFSQHLFGKAPDRDYILLQEFPDEASAFFAEVFLIAYYGRKDRGTGVLRNKTDGGDNPPLNTGCKLSFKHRRKIGDALRGKPKTPAHRAKIGAAQTSRTTSPETRALLSSAHSGKRISAETRQKMSTAHRGKTYPKIGEALKGNQNARRNKRVNVAS